MATTDADPSTYQWLCNWHHRRPGRHYMRAALLAHIVAPPRIQWLRVMKAPGFVPTPVVEMHESEALH